MSCIQFYTCRVLLEYITAVSAIAWYTKYYSSTWGEASCTKNLKNGNKGTDYSATYESVAVPVDRDKEIRTALSTH